MSTLDTLNKLPTIYVGGPQISKTVQLEISEPTYLVLKDGACTVTPGQADAADLTLTASDADMVALLTGKLDGMGAAMSGKLKLKGDMQFAMQLQKLFDGKKLA
jgi:putative sterol carrier protein